jgi:hypothetical protein
LQTPEGYYLVTDTAFPHGTDQIAGHIKAPMKDGARLPVDHAKRENVMWHDRQLLSFQQTAEWGMRTMQGSFGRLCVPLAINDSDLQGDILESTVVQPSCTYSWPQPNSNSIYANLEGR